MQPQNPDPKIIVPNKDGDLVQTSSDGVNAASPNYGIELKVNPSWAHQETSENVVATIVDITSILIAYRLGMDQYGIVSALGYAALDAYVVIWQRKRLTKWVHKFVTFVSG